MSKKPRDNRPFLPPVTRIELSEKNIKMRWILLAVLLAIGATALFMGVRQAVTTEPGWQEVQVSSSEINCSRDFVFRYECGKAGLDATAEYRGVTSLYTDLTESAFRIFSAEAEHVSAPANLSYLNAHVNEALSVDPHLYQVLELICRYDSRYPFLAPVVREYSGVFLSANDGEACLYDPNFDTERMGYVQETLSFAGDPENVRLELLGDNRVCLFVSQHYLDYAGENEIEVFFDLGWMKNAFIADYLAQKLIEAGYTNGSISSFDGFTRNLDRRGIEYAYNLFDRRENTVTIPAQLKYDESMSIVFLRNYPLTEEDQWHYYAYETGSITSVYLDPADGISRSSTDNLVSYSHGYGCGELLLRTAPVFISGSFNGEAIADLAAESIFCIWAEDNLLHYSQQGAKLSLLPESGGADYKLKLFE